MRITALIILIFLATVSTGWAAPKNLRIKKPVKLEATKKKKWAAEHCLARNIYHEARGESFLGQIAVGLVTLERSKDKEVCEAVFEPHAFSWTKKMPPIKDQRSWGLVIWSAKLSVWLKDLKLDWLKADHYHKIDLVKYPRWTYHFEEVATIGNHRFYRSSTN